MGNIIISVVIAAYNSEEYIAECIDSVLNQTMRDFELIIVNDGSTDKTQDIIDNYKREDNRIKRITQENQGAAIARNNGLSIAKGKYTLFFDSDDIMYPDYLETMYLKAEQTSSDIVVCRSNKIIDNNIQEQTLMEFTINLSLLDKKETFSPSEFSPFIFQFFVGWAWDKLFLTKFLRLHNLKFQKLRQSNDVYFVLSALSLATKISIISDVHIIHRYHAKSLEATRQKSPDCFYLALKKLYSFLVKQNLYSLYEKSFINYAIIFGLWHIQTLYKYDITVVSLFKKFLLLVEFQKKDSDFFYDKKAYLDAMEIFWGNKNNYENMLNLQTFHTEEISNLLELQRIHNEELSNLRKEISNLNFYTSFLNLKVNRKKLLAFLKKRNIQNIILYGVGTCGQIFFDMLENSNISITIGFDSKITKYKTVKIKKLDYKKINDIDSSYTIIVTVLKNYDKIVSLLKKQNKCRVLSLIDIINNIDSSSTTYTGSKKN